MTNYGALHPKSYVGQLNVGQGKGRRDLISCGNCITSEKKLR